MAFHLPYTKGSRYFMAVSGLSAFSRCVKAFVYIFGNFAFVCFRRDLDVREALQAILWVV